VSGAVAALIAALVIGFINATLGVAAEDSYVSFDAGHAGIVLVVINALMLELASALLSPGFQVHGFFAAFVGAIVFSLVNLLLKAIVMPSTGSAVARLLVREELRKKQQVPFGFAQGRLSTAPSLALRLRSE
jgi:putative membrane protein